MSKIKNRIDAELKNVEKSVMSDFNNNTNHIDMNKVHFSFNTQLNNKVFEFFNLNTNFYSSLQEFIDYQGLVLRDYDNSGYTDFIDFCKNSVESENGLQDILYTEKINKVYFRNYFDHIIFYFTTQYGDCENDYINYGTIKTGNYLLHFSNGYIFIEDIKSNKQYIYYMD